ncbi:MAG: glycosyltransferase family 39 protein [Acidobacteriota bacterium]
MKLHRPSPPPVHDTLFLVGLAAMKLVLHLPVLGRYGHHHDELYFLSCGLRLDWGYVDHPPAIPALARLAHELFGQSVIGLRLAPLLAGVLTIVSIALLARRLGGGWWAQGLAAGCWMLAPFALRTGNLLCIPAFEPLVWITVAHLLVSIIESETTDRRAGRLWLAVGAVCGVGLLIKHSTLFLGLGLAVGLVTTRERRWLATPWPWLGGLVALAVFAPHLVWQIRHDWPTVDFLRSIDADVTSRISRGQFIAGQFLYFGLLSAVLWIAGLIHCFSAAGRRLRPLGWLWLTAFIVLVSVQSKIYYLAPSYPALIAIGGVVFERWARQSARPRRRLVPFAATLAIAGSTFAPMSLPILDIDRTVGYIDTITFGAFDNVYELTADLRGMFGHRERVDVVAEVWRSLTPEEQSKTAIIADWYGPTSAIDYFGRDLGLPTPASVHMSWYLWGPPEGPIEIVLGVEEDLETFERLFEEVTIAAEVELADVNPWDRRMQVLLARGPKVDLDQVWVEHRRFHH